MSAESREETRLWHYGTPLDCVGYNSSINKTPVPSEEHTGGSSSYYKVLVMYPCDEEVLSYTAECLDIISALEMTHDEANVFKANWRKAAQRQGKWKKGNTGLYDAEKMKFYSDRVLLQEQRK